LVVASKMSSGMILSPWFFSRPPSLLCSIFLWVLCRMRKWYATVGLHFECQGQLCPHTAEEPIGRWTVSCEACKSLQSHSCTKYLSSYRCWQTMLVFQTLSQRSSHSITCLELRISS
jgi:hypothetical protein